MNLGLMSKVNGLHQARRTLNILILVGGGRVMNQITFDQHLLGNF